MIGNQTPARRPKPVTQRDGSKLENQNCRMASISTGLDMQTVGRRTSTGGRMRTYTSDQVGGTGSDDAREAWRKGYAQDLGVQDGASWANVLVSLRQGRGVNLDVWHADLPSGCVSGTGRYGHNIFVLPDCKSGAWLVSDPWCRPAGWRRISEGELRQAALKWGAMVRDQTGRGSTLAQLIAQARELMALWFPTHEKPLDEHEAEPPMDGELPDPDQYETGGYTPVMFTTTNRQPLIDLEEDMALYSAAGKQRTYPKGTATYDAPAGQQVGTIGSDQVVYRQVAQDKTTDPGWVLIDGGGGTGVMRWVKATA